MDGFTGLISVDLPCSEAQLRIERSLERSGLRALETFDLRTARLLGAQCACPRHGTADCDCQMVVLMVYGEGAAPAALMLHGTDGRTWISLPGDRSWAADSSIEKAVEIAVRDLGA